MERKSSWKEGLDCQCYQLNKLPKGTNLKLLSFEIPKTKSKKVGNTVVETAHIVTFL